MTEATRREAGLENPRGEETMTYEETLRKKAREACPLGIGDHIGSIQSCYGCEDIYKALLSVTAPLLDFLAKKDEALNKCRKTAGESIGYSYGLPGKILVITQEGLSFELQPTAEQGEKEASK